MRQVRKSRLAKPHGWEVRGSSWASISVALLALIATSCRPSQAVSTFGTWQPTIAATPAVAALEQQMVQRLNRDRGQRGLPALQTDPRLADIARAHSLDMKSNGFFAHESPRTGVLQDRMDRAGYLALEMRENLATAAAVDTAQDNLLASPGHHANIMATGITHLGIGIVFGDPSRNPLGRTFTQVFARPTYIDAPQTAVSKIRQRFVAARSTAHQPPLASHPMLAQLANQHIANLPDDIAGSAVSRIGQNLSKHLDERNDHGLQSIQLFAQAMFNAEQFTIPGGTDTARFIAVAAAPARDERGRPKLKILLLLAR